MKEEDKQTLLEITKQVLETSSDFAKNIITADCAVIAILISLKDNDKILSDINNIFFYTSLLALLVSAICGVIHLNIIVNMKKSARKSLVRILNGKNLTDKHVRDGMVGSYKPKFLNTSVIICLYAFLTAMAFLFLYSLSLTFL